VTRKGGKEKEEKGEMSKRLGLVYVPWRSPLNMGHQSLKRLELGFRVEKKKGGGKTALGPLGRMQAVLMISTR